jgi:hypothetical protein
VCDEVSLLETARIPMRSFNSTYQDGRIETQALVIEFSDDAVAGMCEKVAQTLLAYPGNCDVFLDLYLRASGLKVRLRPGHSIRVSSAQNLQNELKAAGVSFKWVESQTATARPEPGQSVGSPRFVN